jgi:hypothetical protein
MWVLGLVLCGLSPAAATEGSAQQADFADPSGVNAAPEAVTDCIVTAQDAILTVDLIANDSDPDGDSIRVLDTTQPEDGRAVLQPDGRVEFRAGAPGLQMFHYRLSDSKGGSTVGDVVAIVSPVRGDLEQPLLAGLSDEEVAQLARACVSSAAQDVVILTGEDVIVPLPEAGQVVHVTTQPSQRVELRAAEFASAFYLIVNDALLVLTANGRVVVLDDFALFAETDFPSTLSVAGGPSVDSSELLASLQPVAAPASGEVIARSLPPSAGRTSGGPVLTSVYGYLFDAGWEREGHQGYGLYTYMLIPFESRRGERLLEHLFATTGSRKTSELSPERLNLMLLPAKREHLMELLFGEDPPALSWFTSKAYDYALARDVLASICAKPAPEIQGVCRGDLARGPYLFTYGEPASDLLPVPPPYLFVDLSGTHEAAFAEVLASYKAQVKKPDYTRIGWLEALRLDVLNYLLKAGDLVDPTLAGVSTVGEMINVIKANLDE